VFTLNPRVHAGPTTWRQRTTVSGTGARLLALLLVSLVASPFTAPVSFCSLSTLMASHDVLTADSTRSAPAVVTLDRAGATSASRAVIIEEQLNDDMILPSSFRVGPPAIASFSIRTAGHTPRLTPIRSRTSPLAHTISARAGTTARGVHADSRRGHPSARLLSSS
jgi:hypothetical protein